MSNNVTVNKDALMGIVEPIIDTIIKKNADYGDAWQKYGIFTPLIRLNDKLLRVKTLSGGQKAMVFGESIKDTLLDIVAYGLLALLRMRFEEEHYKANIMNAEAGDYQQQVLPVFNPEIIIQSLDPDDTTKRD